MPPEFAQQAPSPEDILQALGRTALPTAQKVINDLGGVHENENTVLLSPETLTSSISSAPPLILPKFINLISKDKKFLSAIKVGLEFVDVPDATCTFEVINKGSNQIQLKATNAPHFRNYLVPDHYDLVGQSGKKSTTFGLVHDLGNSVYITVSEERPSSGMVTPIIQDLGGNYKFLSVKPVYLTKENLWTIGEPVLHKEIYEIVYDIDKASIRPEPPLIALSTNVHNLSATSDATQTLTYTYTVSETGTWNNSDGVEIGASVTFSAGVPFIASAEFQVSVSASYSHEWGGSKGTEKSVSSSTQITIPPKTSGRAVVSIIRAQLDVTFTYKMRVTYMDGHVEIMNGRKGIYRNVDSYHVDVSLEDMIKL